MRNQPPHDRIVQGEGEGMKIQPSFKFGGLDMAFKGSPFRRVLDMLSLRVNISRNSVFTSSKYFKT